MKQLQEGNNKKKHTKPSSGKWRISKSNDCFEIKEDMRLHLKYERQQNEWKGIWKTKEENWGEK